MNVVRAPDVCPCGNTLTLHEREPRALGVYVTKMSTLFMNMIVFDGEIENVPLPEPLQVPMMRSTLVLPFVVVVIVPIAAADATPTAVSSVAIVPGDTLTAACATCHPNSNAITVADATRCPLIQIHRNRHYRRSESAHFT